MPCLTDSLDLLDESGTPEGAAWNMAMDQSLLEVTSETVLRVYRWDQPALSFGYFLAWEEAAALSGGKPIIRRWTGGGMVEHGTDFTWSLIVPAKHSLSRLRPVESYAAIHGALAAALKATGLPVGLLGSGAPVPSGGFCFESPSPGDLLLRGRKIAGGGQRRCRQGLLHQGTLCGVPLPDEFPQLLARTLAQTVRTFPAGELPVETARELVRHRYGTQAWLKKR